MNCAVGNVVVLVCSLALASAQNTTRKPLQRECVFQPDKCQVFRLSNSTDDGGKISNVTTAEQWSQLISLWGPTGPMQRNESCHIGCQACARSANQRLGFALYQSMQAPGQVRLRVKVTRDLAETTDRKLLPKYPTCGFRQTRREDVTLVDRVVGGQTVLQGEFPWQTQIRLVSNSSHWCGGVIISDRFVLTAAHCMTKALSKYEVVVGQYDLRVKDSSERVFGIKEKVDLPDYLSNGTKVGDLAVLLLDVSKQPAINFSAEVRPACLIGPENAAPAPSSMCVISGWGSTLPSAKEFPFRLRGAEVPIATDKYCSSEEVYGSLFIPRKMVCAGEVKGGVDTCQGDSGGGLVCQAADRSWQVVGIVATGSDDCGAVGRPGIYTELQPYYDKIQDIVKALS